MSIDNEAVRLAYLSKANRRADERMLNIPQSEIQQGKKYSGGRMRMNGGSHKNRYEVEEDIHITSGSERLPRHKGGRKKQTQKDKEDERLADEIRGLKNERMEGGGVKGMKRMVGGAKAKAKKRASDLGKMYGEEVMSMDEEVKDLVGSGFFEDFGRGFMSVIKPVVGVAKHALPFIAPGIGSVAKAGLEAVGFGKTGGAGLPDDLAYTEAVEMDRTRSGGAMCRQGTEMKGRHSRKGGAMTGGKRQQSEKMKKRNELVRKLMRTEGMSLPEASRYIKEHNLM